jgi:hypothetical protein
MGHLPTVQPPFLGASLPDEAFDRPMPKIFQLKNNET